MDPTSAPPAMQVPPVGTAASGFEMPPGLHAPTAERSGEPPAGNPPPATGPESAGSSSAEPPPAEPDRPRWARSGTASDWAPSWARGDGDPAGRRSREAPGPGWASEPSRPYEPVRAEPTRPYEAIPIDRARPYQPSRAEAGPGPEQEPAPEPADRPGWGADRDRPPSAPEEPSWATRAASEPPAGERPSWAAPPVSGAPANEALPWGARSEESPAWGARSEESPAWGARSEESPAWGARSEESPAWGARSEESPAWGARSEEPPAWGPRSDESPAWGARSDEGLPWGSRAAGQPSAEERLPWGLGPASASPSSAPPASAPPSSAPPSSGPPSSAPPASAPPPSSAPPASAPPSSAPPASTPPAWDAPPEPGSALPVAEPQRSVSELSAYRPFRLRPVPDEPAPAPPAADPPAPGPSNAAPYAARRSAPEPEPSGDRSPESPAALLPQRVPAEPDVPVVPEPPAVDPPAETPELARIATHLRRDDESAPLQDRPEGFDVNAILAAVRGVAGVRDASLRRTPAGAHSLRLDLADGADAAEVSRHVARLLQERMGLAAAPSGMSGTPVPPVRRRTGENRGADGDTRSAGEARRPANRPAGARAEAIAARTETPETSRRRRPTPPAPRGRAVAEETGSPGNPATLAASYSGGQLTTTESAPSRPLNTGGAPGPRVVLDHVQVSTFGLDATVEVRLIAGEQNAAGYATGPAVDGYVLRLCAVAAAAAIDELLRGTAAIADRGRCFVEHAAVVPFGNCEVATVVVLLVCDGWVEQIAGSALVAGDPRQAVVRATLAAVNRRLEALLA